MVTTTSTTSRHTQQVTAGSVDGIGIRTPIQLEHIFIHHRQPALMTRFRTRPQIATLQQCSHGHLPAYERVSKTCGVSNATTEQIRVVSLTTLLRHYRFDNHNSRSRLQLLCPPTVAIRRPWSWMEGASYKQQAPASRKRRQSLGRAGEYTW